MRAFLAAAILICVAGEATAGRRRFGWAYDTEVLPERGVELEWWAWERTEGKRREAVVTFLSVLGITDNVELAIPFDVGWWPMRGTQLDNVGLDLRVRLASADPAKAGRIVPLIRAGVRRLFAADVERLEANAAVTIDLPARLTLGLDAGIVGRTDDDPYLTFAGGLGIALGDELRLGVEAYGEVPLEENEKSWAWIGPSLSYTHGRFWVTASCPLPVGGAPGALPRLVWATAF